MPGPAAFIGPVLSPWLTHAIKSRLEFSERSEKPIHSFSFLFLFVLFFFPKAIKGGLSHWGEWHRLMTTQSHGYVIRSRAHLTCIFKDHGRKHCNSGTSITAKTWYDTEEKPTSHQRWLQMQIKRSWKPIKPAGVLANTRALPVGRMEGLWSRTVNPLHLQYRLTQRCGATTVASVPLLSKCGPHSKALRK